MRQTLDTVFRTIAGLPQDLTRWVTSLPESTFFGFMLVAAAVLTFVIVRALR